MALQSRGAPSSCCLTAQREIPLNLMVRNENKVFLLFCAYPRLFWHDACTGALFHTLCLTVVSQKLLFQLIFPPPLSTSPCKGHWQLCSVLLQGRALWWWALHFQNPQSSPFSLLPSWRIFPLRLKRLEGEKQIFVPRLMAGGKISVWPFGISVDPHVLLHLLFLLFKFCHSPF